MKVNLVLLKSSGNCKSFSLPSSVTIVGRRQDCDLCIPLIVVSRRHCQFNLDGGALSVRDLASSNGTFVNGEKIDEVDLSAGDVVQIGPLVFVVQIDGSPSQEEIEGLSSQKLISKAESGNFDINDATSSKDLHRTEMISPPSVDDLLSD